jgi:hypothetical protein
LDGFEEALRAEVDAAPVIDVHTHLRPGKPEADDLADIVLYHHLWIELVSAGMPADAATRAGLPHEVADPGMTPRERLQAALPYLDRIRNTTCASFLRVMLKDLYGVPGGELRAENLEEVMAKAAGRASDPGWRSEVLQNRCRIARSLTVEGRGQPAWSQTIGKGIEVGGFSLVSGKQSSAELVDSIERELGVELSKPEAYGEAMLARGRDYSQRPIHFVGVWLRPEMIWLEPRESEVAAVVARARAGHRLDQEEQSVFTCYGLRNLLKGLGAGPMRTVQVIVGAEVLPPHRSVTNWAPELPGTLARMAGEFEDLHFNCSTAAEAHGQDLAVLAKHIPNVSVGGYWWHTLYPSYIRASIETRLDMVPANKIVAFFSDAYHAEWCYPKLKLVKRILAETVLERVKEGTYTQEVALSLARQVLYENPKRIYGVGG